MTDGHRPGIDFGASGTVAMLAGPDGRIRPLLFDTSLHRRIRADPSEFRPRLDAVR